MASKGAMLMGARSKLWRHFENLLLAGSPRAVPIAFLPCQSSAQEEPLDTAEGVNVSISKYLMHGQGIIISFFCSK